MSDVELLDIDADSDWPEEGVYNVKVLKAETRRTKETSQSPNSPYLALQVQIIEHPETDEKFFLNFFTYLPFGVRQFKKMVKAATGEELSGAIQFDPETLVDKTFSCHIVHNIQEDEVTGLQAKPGSYKPADFSTTSDDDDVFDSRF